MRIFYAIFYKMFLQLIKKPVCLQSQMTSNCREGREISSAGSEHLPYKQGVTGSNPVSPTQDTKEL